MPASKRPLSDWWGLAALAAVLGMVAWSVFGARADEAVPRGTPLPPLAPQGWLNLAANESFQPAGELVVVDCWATWCPPCREDLPRMALVVADYQPRGVKFVGVTQETAEDLPAIKSVIAKTPGFTWPVAYGAFEFFNTLPLQGIPTVILFGRDGQARWSGHGSHGLAAALDEALTESTDRAPRAPKS